MQVRRRVRGGSTHARWRLEPTSFVFATLVISVIAAVLTIPRIGAGFVATTDNSANAVAADTLDPPTSVVPTSGVSVRLDWTATVDTYATGYRIFRSATPGGPYTQIAELADPALTTYTETPAEGTYFYMLRTYFQSWESVDSNEVQARKWRQFDCPSDPDLVACIRFDTDAGGHFDDETTYGNDVLHTAGVQVPGISGQAIDGDPARSYQMLDSASLDLTSAATMEMWVRIDSLPGTGRAGLIDNDGQYSVIYNSATGLRCDPGPHDVTYTGSIPVGVWFHIGCVWDGSDVTLYLNGQPVITTPSTGVLDTTNTNPLAILNTSPLFDEPLDGAMDNLRIWRTGRTQAQICTDAGLTGC